MAIVTSISYDLPINFPQNHLQLVHMTHFYPFIVFI